MKRKIAASAGLALVVFLVTGCAQSDSLSSYSDIEDLKQAFESAGGQCQNWDHNDDVVLALQSGVCDPGGRNGGVLMLFGSFGEAREKALFLEKEMQRIDCEGCVALGGNWVINSPHAHKVHAVLGGKLLADAAGGN
jgi:hypothetical protein